MAPIYAANTLGHNSIQAPEFIQRDLNGLTTGKLENLHIVGHPIVLQPHYPQYIANLPAFLTATAIGRKVVCGGPFYPLLKPETLIAFPLPPLTVAPAKPFKKDEEKAAFLAKLPSNTQTVVYMKRECYVVPSLTPVGVAALPPVDANVPSSPDSVSLNGLRQFLSTLKVLTLFLATHTYPAFQTDADNHQGEFDCDLDFHFTSVVEPKVGARGGASLYSNKDVKKMYAKQVPGPQEFANYPVKEATYAAKGGVFVAKPAPLYPQVNYGPPSAIPSLPGFLFPYFHGLTYPSESVMVTIMRRFFLGCFGENSEDSESHWCTWVKSVSKWHRTKAGMGLIHVFFCLQTALECQGRLFVVLSNGEYFGCAILGYKFNISFNGNMIGADEASKIHEYAANLDEHSKALKEIQDKLRTMALVGSEDIDPDADVDVSTARALHKEILKRQKPEQEEIDELTGLVQKLVFTQKFWPLSGDTMARAISLIISDDAVPNDWPMYLEPTLIFDTSRIFEVLSVFGPMAPSLIDAGGTEVKIPQGAEAEDPESCVPEGGVTIRRPKLFISGKKLHVSCNDMRSVFNKRKIRQNVTERAGGFRTIAVVGKQRDTLWNALKMVPWESTVAEKGKKRGAEDDGNQEKKKQKGSEVVEETLGLF